MGVFVLPPSPVRVDTRCGQALAVVRPLRTWGRHDPTQTGGREGTQIFGGRSPFCYFELTLNLSKGPGVLEGLRTPTPLWTSRYALPVCVQTPPADGSSPQFPPLSTPKSLRWTGPPRSFLPCPHPNPDGRDLPGVPGVQTRTRVSGGPGGFRTSNVRQRTLGVTDGNASSRWCAGSEGVNELKTNTNFMANFAV